MELTDSDKSIEKPKQVRTKRALWRYKENGVYSHAPKDDPDYYKRYYHEKIKLKIECPLCKRMTGAQKLSRHQESTLCLKNRV